MNCFLDRDGVINTDLPYVGKIKDFFWCEYIFDILSCLQRRGYKLILVTNQSGIARGYYSLRDFYQLSFYILNTLDGLGIDLEITYCPHGPWDNCFCRKPKPGMFDRFCLTSQDIMIGNNCSDMEAACTAGIPNRWIISDQPSGPYTSSFQTHRSLASHLSVIK